MDQVSTEFNTVVNKTYQHYKGGIYRILFVGYHTETLEKFVVYQAVHVENDPELCPIWIRPYDMFFEKITVNEKEILRFTPLEQ